MFKRARSGIDWFFRWGEHVEFAKVLLESLGLWDYFKVTTGGAIVTGVGLFLGRLASVPASWLWVGGLLLFTVTGLIILIVLARKAHREIKGLATTQINQNDERLPDNIVDSIPDVRVADYPAMAALFENAERDKLFPLLESEKLAAWARPMGETIYSHACLAVHGNLTFSYIYPKRGNGNEPKRLLKRSHAKNQFGMIFI